LESNPIPACGNKTQTDEPGLSSLPAHRRDSKESLGYFFAGAFWAGGFAAGAAATGAQKGFSGITSFFTFSSAVL
jgi:hypothetical protein